MSEVKKLSAAEGVKEASEYLRGPIPQELVDGNDHFGKASIQLLKHHGTYQQDDREQRKASTSGGKSARSYIFMVRTKIPGGKLTGAQLLAELDLADELGNATLRITSRQGLQLHGVVKTNLWQAIHRINEVQLTTLGACGDVNRNVMCCPAPYSDPMYRQVQELADQIADHLAPRTSAYHDIWITDPSDGQRHHVPGGNGAPEVEPIYGRHYLPRKFKTAIAFCHDNCIDLYANDLGLLAVVRDGQIAGYNVLVGGGMGVTPSAAKTFPAVAKRMAFITPEQVIDVATAVVLVQRDHGNREDRKVARLKYLIHSRRRRAVRVLAPRAPARRRARSQRSHGLGRAGRRPLVLRAQRRERPHPRQSAAAAQNGAARDLRRVESRHSPHRPPERFVYRSD
jgi:sulfite reductase (ferredoxin)